MFTVRCWRRDRVNETEQEQTSHTEEFKSKFNAEIYASALEESVSCFRVQVQDDENLKVVQERIACTHRNKDARANQIVNDFHWVWKRVSNPVFQVGDITAPKNLECKIKLFEGLYDEHCDCNQYDRNDDIENLDYWEDNQSIGHYEMYGPDPIRPEF